MMHWTSKKFCPYLYILYKLGQDSLDIVGFRWFLCHMVLIIPYVIKQSQKYLKHFKQCRSAKTRSTLIYTVECADNFWFQWFLYTTCARMKRNYERIMYLVNPTECAGHAGVDPGHCSVASHAPGSNANLEAINSDSPGRTDNEA